MKENLQYVLIAKDNGKEFLILTGSYENMVECKSNYKGNCELEVRPWG